MRCGNRVAADTQPVGDRINVLLGFPASYPANTPFHIRHGWGLLPHVEAGIFSFELDVDGVPREEDFVLRFAVPPGLTGLPNVILVRTWVHNFAAGMTGTHTFTGHWIAPCDQADDVGEYTGPCRTPNEPVEAITRSLTVTFTP
jgi:hypothetical protein